MMPAQAVVAGVFMPLTIAYGGRLGGSGPSSRAAMLLGPVGSRRSARSRSSASNRLDEVFNMIY
ncbi:hypothetical protein PR003_g9170 [Phytophthora rubi]|uniref:Uncharacterized protein n=1 Tax=Phytophthora rubi TaxID=129364 RepID=A0A6A3N581_9STRA|nr:hypothetical protein PR002_g8086 [Phytophthora rubi]KAE9039434.1 hypothetical protein PR001_g7504 [Phytophthora rubi]KAE9343062.1 hypothetical protein PR003_g9170 [Phytophthora rubi]